MIGWISHVSVALIGLAGGLVVGSALVAVLVVLDIIPRLAQFSHATYAQFIWIESALVSGAMVSTWVWFYDWKFHAFPLGASFVGLLAGVFVGMLAGALTEVLNVLPILAKRLRIGDYIIWLLMSMVLGKVTGSCFEWLVFHHINVGGR